MRRLLPALMIAVFTLLSSGAAAVPSAQAADVRLSWAIQQSEKFWSNDPKISQCRGNVKAKWSNLPTRGKLFQAGATLINNCHQTIRISPRTKSLPSWRLCAVVVHEYGHALGHVQKSDPHYAKNAPTPWHDSRPNNIMYWKQTSGGAHPKVCDSKVAVSKPNKPKPTKSPGSGQGTPTKPKPKPKPGPVTSGSYYTKHKTQCKNEVKLHVVRSHKTSGGVVIEVKSNTKSKDRTILKKCAGSPKKNVVIKNATNSKPKPVVSDTPSDTPTDVPTDQPTDQPTDNPTPTATPRATATPRGGQTSTTSTSTGTVSQTSTTGDLPSPSPSPAPAVAGTSGGSGISQNAAPAPAPVQPAVPQTIAGALPVTGTSILVTLSTFLALSGGYFLYRRRYQDKR